jgi:hypothetical protein
MKKPITKWVIVAILILFIAYSGFATYKWLEAERIEEGIEVRMLNDAIDISDIPLWELSQVGLVAEYLITPDTTGELLNARIYQYFYHARTLSYSSRILHTLTDDEKYQLFGAAMRSLQMFFIGVGNDRPDDMKETLTTNLDALKQMDDTLEEILRINSLTLADAEKILQLSGNLTVG